MHPIVGVESRDQGSAGLAPPGFEGRDDPLMWTSQHTEARILARERRRDRDRVVRRSVIDDELREIGMLHCRKTPRLNAEWRWDVPPMRMR